MKWETIKNKCARQASSEFEPISSMSSKSNISWGILLAQLIKEGNPMGFYDAQKTAKEKCYSIIDSWDIRQWESLKSIFPNVFPKNLKTPELTDKGWELI